MTSSATSQTSNGSEVSAKEANARFFKYLQVTYTVAKELDEECVNATNTKREIKALITTL
jgi:hypothetical protein